MRNFFFLILFLVNTSYSNPPDWIKEPIKSCLNNEICVLGSGKTLEKATITAREELAKVLKVKIIGNTIFNTYSRQIRENEAVEGNVSENFNKGIEEISEEITEIGRCLYCKRESIGLFRYEPHNKEYPLCNDHASKFLKEKQWTTVKSKQETVEGCPRTC